MAPAIIDTVEEQRADLVVIGWGGVRNQHNAIALGSNIEQVLDQVNCDVMMLQPGDTATARRILIPIADPRQVSYSLQLIRLFSGSPKLELDLLHVFAPDTPPAERERFQRTLQRQIEAVKLDGAPVNLLTEQSADRIEALVEASRDYDYLVLGLSRDPRLRQRLFGNTTMMIAQRTATPVLLLHPETSPLQFSLRQTFHYMRGGYAAVDPESRQRLEEQGYIDGAAKPASSLKSSVSQPLLGIGILTAAAAVLMLAGNGGALTWVGAVAYFVALLVFTWASFRAVRSASA